MQQWIGIQWHSAGAEGKKLRQQIHTPPHPISTDAPVFTERLQKIWQ